MKGTKKLRFFKRCVALLMVVFMLFTVPVLEGGTAKAAELVPDANVRAAINLSLSYQTGTNRDPNASLTAADLALVEGFVVTEGPVSTLEGVDKCTNLKSIAILSGSSTSLDLSKLSGLTKLEGIELTGVKANDYSVLGNFPKLKGLSIRECDITTLPNMSKSTGLVSVDISYNQSLTDISGLKNNNNLSYVDLEGNAVSDISALKGKTGIKELSMWNTPITDANKSTYMSTMSSLVNVELFRGCHNDYKDEHMSMFDTWTKIQTMEVFDNDISDVTFATKHNNSLRHLNISSNPIKDGSKFASLTNLQTLDIGYTDITDFSFVSKMSSLVKGDMSVNWLTSDSWTSYSKTPTYGANIKESVKSGVTTYAIKNTVKDQSGKNVAPVASSKYTYNATTNEIIIKLDGTGTSYETGQSYDGVISYNIDLKSAKGETLYASHSVNYSVFVRKALAINTHPESQKVDPGEEVTFRVSATGAQDLKYQWYKDGEPLAWETFKTYYTVDEANKDTTGEYYVVVTDYFGDTITSNKAQLSLNVDPIVITTQPADYTTDEGDEIYFAVTATGEGTLSYQWYKDGVAIDGATDRTYTKQNVDETDIAKYHVVVSNDYENVASDKAQANVNLIPLEITTQPEDTSVTEKENTTLSVVAKAGKGTLIYQWYKDGVAITGATSSTLKLDPVEDTDAGEYYVVVKDARQTKTSDTVTVDVKLIPLKITTQPKSVTVGEEKTATLSVAAVAGKGTLTYQWYKDGKTIAGATAATLKIDDASASDEGKYYVIVKDARETVKSTEVSVVVELIPLEITAQPVGAQLKEDAAATLKVTATGKGTLTYQWYKDGNPITGATAATLEIADASASDEGKYYVIVKDERETVKSTEVSVTVELIPLEITAQPVSTTLGEGKDGSLSVTATGKGTLTYQWYKDGVAIDGATAATLEIPEASTADEGKYHVVVKDVRNTVESEKIDVKVALIPLEITGQPVGVELTEGGSTSLVVKATGKGTLTYQWYKGDKAIEGATKDTLLLEELKVEDSGEYYVVVKDERNQTASVKALVKVVEKTTEAPTTENTTEAPTNKPPVDGPATGDGPMPVVFVMMLLAGMASLGLAKLRKKNI